MVTERRYDAVHATSPAQMRALSHPARHKLLRALAPEGATISQLSNRLAMNKGSVSHHLTVLREAGLVHKGPTRTVRGGTEQYFVPTAHKVLFGAAAYCHRTVLRPYGPQGLVPSGRRRCRHAR